MSGHPQRPVHTGGRRPHAQGANVALYLVMTFAAMSGFRAEAAAPQSAPSQAEIGAAFIFNFAKFTEWPPQSFADGSTPVTVCFLGGQDVRSAFQSITAGKTVNGRLVRAHDVKSAAEIHACQIVYTDSPDIAVITGVLKNSRQCSALAIGTSDDFLLRGGMIRLLVESNRMRFDVNVGAAERTKIRLSSKLLALARSVVDLPDPAAD